jgi:dienelactone hydrolase
MNDETTMMPTSTFSFSLSASRRLLAGLALSALSLHALADSPYQKGPNPTLESLEAAKGPFAISNAKLPASSEYGAASTVYYPTDRAAGKHGLLVLCPGFVSSASQYSGVAQRIASHGFVVAVVSTKTLLDLPKARSVQIVAVMKAVLAQNKVPAVAYAGLVDESRVAFSGHSAGGAGTFYAAATNPQVKALIGIMPGEPSSNFTPFAGIRIPSLILTGETDTIANTWSRPYFESLSADLPAAKIELGGTGHLASWSTSSAAQQGKVAKYMTAWVKRFLDDDTRYTPFIKTAASDMSVFATKGDY